MEAKLWLKDYLAARKKLTDLEVKQRREARNTIAKACTLVLKAMRSRVHQLSGLVKKSLGSSVKTYNVGGKTVGVVGVRRGFAVTVTATVLKGRRTIAIAKRLVQVGSGKSFKGYRVNPGKKDLRLKNQTNLGRKPVINPAKYGPLLEHGHKKGKGKGAADPFPFVAPAVNSTRSEVKATIRAGIVNALKGS